LPTATDYIAAAAIGTKIYLFGGDTSSGSSASIQIFDTTTNTLTVSSTVLPISASNIGSAAINKKIYLFGGTNTVSGVSNPLYTINVFNTETQQISTLSTQLPKSFTGISCTSSGSTIYLFGGYDGTSDYLNVVGTFNVLTSEFSARTNTLLIETGDNTNTFELLPNVKLGVSAVYYDDASGNRTKVSTALYKNGAWTEI
jgi:N-acetylneuraminic acid mutarotase